MATVTNEKGKSLNCPNMPYFFKPEMAKIEKA
jgi:hypothetical protein